MIWLIDRLPRPTSAQPSFLPGASGSLMLGTCAATGVGAATASGAATSALLAVCRNRRRDKSALESGGHGRISVGRSVR